MVRVPFTIAMVALGLSIPRLATAQYASPPSDAPTLSESDQAAKQHFTTATQLYEAGQFQLAANEFEQAYRLSGRPEVLYNLYAAYRDAGNTEKAAENLRAYLDKVPNAPDRVQLQARLHSLDQLNAKPKRGAIVAATTPEPKTSDKPSAAAEPDEGDEPTNFTSDILPWLLVGVGGAALVAGTITGLMALGKTSTIEDNCPGDICPPNYDFESERDSASSLATATDVLLIGGGLLAATGVVLLFVLDDDTEQQTLSAACTPAFCGAHFKGNF